MPGNRIMMDDAERILVLPHMDAGKQPPGAADGVEGLAAHRAEPDEAGKLLIDEEIGRASCRERVCQYVSISVVGVYLQKKNKNITTRREHSKNETDQSS